MLQPDPQRQYHTPQKKYDDVRVSTEIINHRSEAVNYGKITPLELYVVWCLKCDSECATTNVIDGEEKNGTIQEPVICLWSARCKECLKEWYF